MVKIKKIGVLSAAKVAGFLYTAFGFIGVLVMVPLMMLPRVMSMEASGTVSPVFAILAIVLIPISYGVMGFVMGALGAFLYNFVAARAGGVELEIETDKS